MKLRFLPIVLLTILLVPFVVMAQTGPTNPCSTGANIGLCVARIYIWSIGVSGLLAVLMSVLGGYLIMSARGNGAQVQKGKDYIYSSLIGMVLLLAAYLILNTINTDLTNFNVDLNAGPSATPAVPPPGPPPGPGPTPAPGT